MESLAREWLVMASESMSEWVGGVPIVLHGLS